MIFCPRFLSNWCKKKEKETSHDWNQRKATKLVIDQMLFEHALQLSRSLLVAQCLGAFIRDIVYIISLKKMDPSTRKNPHPFHLYGPHSFNIHMKGKQIQLYN